METLAQAPSQLVCTAQRQQRAGDAQEESSGGPPLSALASPSSWPGPSLPAFVPQLPASPASVWTHRPPGPSQLPGVPCPLLRSPVLVVSLVHPEKTQGEKMRRPPSPPREPLTPLHLDVRPDIVLSTDHTPGAWIMSPPSSLSTLAPILQMERLRLKDRGTRGPAVSPLQMQHPVSAAPTEPASRWPLKGSGAGGGGGGLFIPAIEGASGRQERADGAPSRPPAHRPPP
ncbi:uncharacterized protein [Odocoileus virginianus]|uniref:Uncharacterized protein n=1 Tax=Odocoileus virginianus TaxID=9874 RepID=A0ABM4J327_ODOVR